MILNNVSHNSDIGIVPITRNRERPAERVKRSKKSKNIIKSVQSNSFESHLSGRKINEADTIINLKTNLNYLGIEKQDPLKYESFFAPESLCDPESLPELFKYVKPPPGERLAVNFDEKIENNPKTPQELISELNSANGIFRHNFDENLYSKFESLSRSDSISAEIVLPFSERSKNNCSLQENVYDTGFRFLFKNANGNFYANLENSNIILKSNSDPKEDSQTNKFFNKSKNDTDQIKIDYQNNQAKINDLTEVSDVSISAINNWKKPKHSKKAERRQSIGTYSNCSFYILNDGVAYDPKVELEYVNKSEKISYITPNSRNFSQIDTGIDHNVALIKEHIDRLAPNYLSKYKKDSFSMSDSSSSSSPIQVKEVNLYETSKFELRKNSNDSTFLVNTNSSQSNKFTGNTVSLRVPLHDSSDVKYENLIVEEVIDSFGHISVNQVPCFKSTLKKKLGENIYQNSKNLFQIESSVDDNVTLKESLPLMIPTDKSKTKSDNLNKIQEVTFHKSTKNESRQMPDNNIYVNDNMKIFLDKSSNRISDHFEPNLNLNLKAEKDSKNKTAKKIPRHKSNPNTSASIYLKNPENSIFNKTPLKINNQKYRSESVGTYASAINSTATVLRNNYVIGNGCDVFNQPSFRTSLNHPCQLNTNNSFYNYNNVPYYSQNLSSKYRSKSLVPQSIGSIDQTLTNNGNCLSNQVASYSFYGSNQNSFNYQQICQPFPYEPCGVVNNSNGYVSNNSVFLNNQEGVVANNKWKIRSKSLAPKVVSSISSALYNGNGNQQAKKSSRSESCGVSNNFSFYVHDNSVSLNNSDGVFVNSNQLKKRSEILAPKITAPILSSSFYGNSNHQNRKPARSESRGNRNNSSFYTPYNSVYMNSPEVITINSAASFNNSVYYNPHATPYNLSMAPFPNYQNQLSQGFYHNSVPYYNNPSNPIISSSFVYNNLSNGGLYTNHNSFQGSQYNMQFNNIQENTRNRSTDINNEQYINYVSPLPKVNNVNFQRNPISNANYDNINQTNRFLSHQDDSETQVSTLIKKLSKKSNDEHKLKTLKPQSSLDPFNSNFADNINQSKSRRPAHVINGFYKNMTNNPQLKNKIYDKTNIDRHINSKLNNTSNYLDSRITKEASKHFPRMAWGAESALIQNYGERLIKNEPMNNIYFKKENRAQYNLKENIFCESQLQFFQKDERKLMNKALENETACPSLKNRPAKDENFQVDNSNEKRNKIKLKSFSMFHME